MRRQPAAWLLAMLIVLGAGQAAPVISLQQRSETCAVVCVARAHRQQHVPRDGGAQVHAAQNIATSGKPVLRAVAGTIDHSQLLRAPPGRSLL